MSTNPSQLLSAFSSEYGFDPSRVHCLATGKPLGNYYAEEFDSILSLVCESNDDADEAADDLALRCLASMRPSLKWNKFREESLAELRKSDPLETLAYLINRMFAPHNRLKGGMLFEHYRERIQAWQRVESWGVGDETNTLTYMLLEIDAKMNLDEETPPFNWQDFFEAESMAIRIQMVQNWYANLMERWEKRLKQEELQSRWIRYGSRLAKPAFRDAYLESKPLSATAIKKAEKKAEKDFFAGLIFELAGGKENIAKEIKTEPSPILVRRRNPFAKKA